MEIGEKIRRYIDSIGVSQAYISKKTGIPATKLNLTLNGKRKLTFREYEAICCVLNVGCEKFLEPKAPIEQ